MILGVVTGSLTSTMKHAAYEGERILTVRRLDGGLQSVGPEFFAVDRAQAGPGDHVLILQEGNGVRQLFKGDVKATFPVLETIVGVVDSVQGVEPAE